MSWLNGRRIPLISDIPIRASPSSFARYGYQSILPGSQWWTCASTTRSIGSRTVRLRCHDALSRHAAVDERALFASFVHACPGCVGEFFATLTGRAGEFCAAFTRRLGKHSPTFACYLRDFGSPLAGGLGDLREPLAGDIEQIRALLGGN